MIELIKSEFEEAQQVLHDFFENEENIKKINLAADWLVASFENGGKAISCGNGGSACDAAHFAEELSGKFRNERKALPAIAISDSSHLTCVANDYGFEKIFSRFVEALGNNGDVLLAISTSGNSPNIIEAVLEAKAKGMKTICLTGKSGGKLKEIADLEIRVEHHRFSDRIQEIHIKIIHILILLIEKKMGF